MQLLPLGGFLHMGGLLEAQGLIHELRNVVGVLVDREAAALLCKHVAGDVAFLGQGAVDHDRPADLLDGQDLLPRGMDTVDREVVNVPGLRAGLAEHALLRGLTDMPGLLQELAGAAGPHPDDHLLVILHDLQGLAVGLQTADLLQNGLLERAVQRHVDHVLPIVGG